MSPLLLHSLLVACSVLMLSVLPCVYAQEVLEKVIDVRDKSVITANEAEDYLFLSSRSIGKIDKEGSEMPKPQINRLVPRIEFKFGSYIILPESYTNLDAIGQALVQHQTRVGHSEPIEIAGHTDSDGDKRLNDILSNNRAQSVKKYLIRKFPTIARESLITAGYGQQKPLCDEKKNDTPQCKQQNRRVEVVSTIK